MPSHSSNTPFHAMVKPAGASCNLRCRYCFYLEKEALYSHKAATRMNDEVLKAHICKYIAAQPMGVQEINFAWQGGEPTLMGLGFFKKAVELEKKHARPGMRVTNALQTNGTLLNDKWCEFLKKEDFLVGISIDGPAKYHDPWRVDGAGAPTHAKVMMGLEALKKHGVEFNALTCVQALNSHHPAKVYDFLKAAGITFFQFIPIVEKQDQGVSERSVSPAQFGSFLIGIFERWLECGDIGKIYIQHFDMMLGLACGYPSSLCVHSPTCGRATAVEHNGDVYACDHFVTPEHKLGNVTQSTYTDMVDSQKQRKFGNDKSGTLPAHCLSCNYLKYCWGACPKDRIHTTPQGEKGLNYLCEGYRAFYDHTLPVWLKMAHCLARGRPATDWQQMPEAAPYTPDKAKGMPMPGRNGPCPCGSGKKYKKCCGQSPGPTDH